MIDRIIETIKNIFGKNNNESNKQTIETGNKKGISYEDKLLQQYGNCEEKKTYNIKILFITDTHNCLTYDKETLEKIKSYRDYDCCILLGDHSANDLYEILQIVPKEKIYGVLGNHDGWDKYKEYSINDINGKVVNIKGIRIAGISGSYKYKDSDKYALYTHEESIEIANRLEKADILITHDKAFTQKEIDEAHDGLKGITEYIYKNQIPVHIHGHLHEEKKETLKNGTVSICVYKVKYMQF